MLKGNRKQVLLHHAITPLVATPGNLWAFFFFPVFNQAMEIKNEENLFILASTAHLKHFFSKKCAEAIFWSFLALFSLTSLDSRQLVMTSSELQ